MESKAPARQVMPSEETHDTPLRIKAPRRGKAPKHFVDLTPEERRVIVTELGQPPFRANQLANHYFARFTANQHDWTDIPLAARADLQAAFFPELLTPVKQLKADGGSTVKTLWRLFDGLKIESVLMRYPKRTTLCISSQVGCGMACPFCATGQMGLFRNLSAGEMVDQVRAALSSLAAGDIPAPKEVKAGTAGQAGVELGSEDDDDDDEQAGSSRGASKPSGARTMPPGEGANGNESRRLSLSKPSGDHAIPSGEDTESRRLSLSKPSGVHAIPSGDRANGNGSVPGGAAPESGAFSQTRLNNIVFMGMGEGLANYKPLLHAIRTVIAPAPAGLGIGARHLTVSTVGLVPAIHRFAGEGIPAKLALSLHAPDDELRNELVPINTRWGVAETLDAARAYFDATGRRVSIEYALIKDMNDQAWRAELLAKKLNQRGRGWVHINPIPLNPTPGSIWTASDKAVEDEFVLRLRDAGIPTTVRDTRGSDIDGACGQLAADEG